MVLNYKRSQLMNATKINLARKIDFSKVSKQKKYEINKLLVRITSHQPIN